MGAGEGRWASKDVLAMTAVAMGGVVFRNRASRLVQELLDVVAARIRRPASVS